MTTLKLKRLIALPNKAKVCLKVHHAAPHKITVRGGTALPTSYPPNSTATAGGVE